MAEYAANFTQTFQNKPSVFEIIAQKSLNDTLHPALQKLSLFLGTNYPHKFNFLNKYYEETFLVLNGLLQYYYLKYYDSSFSENFYGLRRILSSGVHLTKHHKELSLIFLVVLPYFRRKIEERLVVYRIENAEGCLRKDFEGRLKKAFIYSHSVLEVIWGLITVHNYLKYMGNETEYQLPILQLIDVKLIYSDEQTASPGFWSALFKGKLSFPELSFGLIRNGVTATFEVAAFFLQFLQTWSTQQSNYNLTDLPNVQPPPLDSKSGTYRGICPICLKRWKNPTVLPVSGYIFCFKCILKQLSENQKCPITSLPAKPLDIVRLYV